MWMQVLRGWWSTPFPFQGVSGYDLCFLWLEGELEGVGSAHPRTLAIAFYESPGRKDPGESEWSLERPNGA